MANCTKIWVEKMLKLYKITNSARLERKRAEKKPPLARWLALLVRQNEAQAVATTDIGGGQLAIPSLCHNLIQ